MPLFDFGRRGSPIDLAQTNSGVEKDIRMDVMTLFLSRPQIGFTTTVHIIVPSAPFEPPGSASRLNATLAPCARNRGVPAAA